jgi:hypothetical protein
MGNDTQITSVFSYMNLRHGNFATTLAMHFTNISSAVQLLNESEKSFAQAEQFMPQLPKTNI